MNSIELSSSRDHTENNHTLVRSHKIEMEIPRFVSLANITLYHTWRNITAEKVNNWFRLLKIKPGRSKRDVGDGRRSKEDIIAEARQF